MSQRQSYLRGSICIILAICVVFVLFKLALRISSKSSLQLEEIISQSQLADAMGANHCVIVTQMGWSAQSLFKSHLVALLQKERKEAGRAELAYYAMELSDPKPAFVVEWLHAHPEISPDANEGFGEVVCIANGTPVRMIREFDSILELDKELCHAFSLE